MMSVNGWAACFTGAMERCEHCEGRGYLPPLKMCANERCLREFRWQEGRSRTAARRSLGVIFCSPRCAKAQNQRDRRMADRYMADALGS